MELYASPSTSGDISAFHLYFCHSLLSTQTHTHPETSFQPHSSRLIRSGSASISSTELPLPFQGGTHLLPSLSGVLSLSYLPWGFAVTYKRGCSYFLNTLQHTDLSSLSQSTRVYEATYLHVRPFLGSGDTVMDNAKSLPLGAYSFAPIIGAQ